jgi:hypothetical protein
VDNQNRKIFGYRDLSQEEIELINRVKTLGLHMEGILADITRHIASQRTCANSDVVVNNDPKIFNRLENATPERFLSIARTDFQTGLMAATRAVGQPESF